MAELVERLRVRMASTEQPVQSLSGGNQQKVSLIRPFLRGDVKVILAEEPTQGVDVGARFDIYEALRAKADEGIAAVVKSSDPLELAGLCDRVVVMSRGRIVEEIPRHELGERRIVEAIVGSRRGRHGGRRRERRNVAREAGLAAARPDDGADRRPRRVRGAHSSAFLSKENLNSLLLEAMPLILVSMGQAVALLVGGFDVSVAALMTLCVVIASFTLTPTTYGHRARARRARPRRRGHRDRSLQRVPDPGAAPAVDRGDARHAQHPRGSVALAPLLPVGRDQHRRDQRPDHGRRLRSARIRRRRRSRRARRPLASTGRGPGSPSARSASTRRRRAGWGCPPAARSSSRSSCAR